MPEKAPPRTEKRNEVAFTPIVFDIHDIDWLNMPPPELLTFMQEKVVEMVLNFDKNGKPGMKIEIGRITSIPLASGQLIARKAVIDDEIPKLSMRDETQQIAPLHSERQQIDVQISQVNLLHLIFNKTLLEKGFQDWARPSLTNLLIQKGVNASIPSARLNRYSGMDIEITLNSVTNKDRGTYDFVVLAIKMKPNTAGVFQAVKNVFWR
ncbi:hypothetical protein KBC89_05145 [Candidatus Woesebacteria bacterium]|nr:hypothetical protein [Candidatus Woesebacteria bacterium]